MFDPIYHVKGTCQKCLGKAWVEYNGGTQLKGLIRSKPTGWVLCKCGFHTTKSDIGAKK